MLRWLIFFTLILIAPSISCFGQAKHWSEVPEIVSSDLSNFRRIFRDAHQNGTGITILGDSQETIPGGGGAVYVPALGNEFFEHYGNIPRTGIAYGASYGNAWLMAAASAGVENVRRNEIFSGLVIGSYNNSVSAYGLLAQVNIDAHTTPFIDPPALGFFNGSPLEAELIVRAGPGTAEVFWRAYLHDSDRRNYFGGETIDSGTTNLNLDRPEEEYLSINLGTFDLDDHKALQIIARGDEDGLSTDIVGVRFRNAQNDYGISVQSFSEGGSYVQRFNDRYVDRGVIFNVLTENDVIAVQFGANDSTRRTAVEFKEDLRTLITNIRQWANDPNRPILLISDPDRDGVGIHRSQFDLFPGVAAELAEEYDNILALNTRRLAAENGWFVGSPDFLTFAPDTIHYSQLGAKSLAQWQVASLLSLAEIGDLGDCNFDGVVNFLDISQFVEHLNSGIYIEEADCNQDNQVNFFDIIPFIEILRSN